MRIRILSLAVGIAVLASSVLEAELGDVPAGGFRSPEGDARFTARAGARPLNNLVFELLNVGSPQGIAYIFRNPREGWVYIRVSPASDNVNWPDTAFLDDHPVKLRKVDGCLEAMRYVAEGPHAVNLAPDAGPIGRLEVRAVGELFYAAYGSNPHIPEMGVHTWPFLRRHCLDHFNSIIGVGTLTAEGKSTQEAEINEWTAEGKRWFTLHPLPMVESADEAFSYWTKTAGMSHPKMHGIWGDEFGPRLAKHYPAWVEALKRIRADTKYKARKFYAYCPNRLWPLEHGYEVMFPFIQTLLDCGYRLGPEWYLPESHSRPGRLIHETKDLLAEFGPGWVMASRESFERAARGASTNCVIVLSLLSEPGWETGDLFARYDYNVFLDAQFQFVATDPAYFALRGVQGYLSSYCGEEQLRLFARLMRHYAIEGNTSRLLDDPYVLGHIQNADLQDGTEGWTIAPGAEQSIAAKTIAGFGALQAKYHAPKGAGDDALWTRRSAERPNVISQTVRDLRPGRLYSIRLITGDYQELQAGKSIHRKHAVSITVDGGECIDDKSFQAIVDAGHWSSFGAFNRNNRYCLNYHRQVFRATSEAAKLQLSDWLTAESSGGPVGEELIWNFIQVQPYFE